MWRVAHGPAWPSNGNGRELEWASVKTCDIKAVGAQLDGDTKRGESGAALDRLRSFTDDMFLDVRAH